MSSIQINDVTKSFGDFHAVSHLSLDIAEGEFVALLGPSGCGKTTTMNMIAGLEDPTDGKILFNGKDLSHTRIQDRNIGFVFQNYAIFTHLTVYQNLAYGLAVRNVTASEVTRRVDAMAKRMNLSHRLGNKASSLSVNEMQKLAIGRSAIVEPRIFLLDEPLSNLDAAFRAYMRAELKILQREFGQTMIYVTHDQVEAMSLADKMAVIDKGKLMQYGTPLELYNNPRNRFVANFVGSPRINMLDGDLRQESGRLRLLVDGGTEIELSGSVGADAGRCGPDGSASIGIRPQDIYFGDSRAADDLELVGVVEELEGIGPKRHAYLKVQNTRLMALNDRDELTVGQQVAVHFAASKCMAFDGRTGQRLGGAPQ